MNRVTFSLELQMSGPAVADLHAALQVLMVKPLVKPHVVIPGPVAGVRPQSPIVSAPPNSQPPSGPVKPPPLPPLGERFKGERFQQYFGNATAELVEIFQAEHKQEYGLEFTGYVDEPTANAINSELRKLGLLEEPEERPPFTVRGVVRDAEGRPVAGTIVEVFDQDMRSRQLLGQVLTDEQGAYELSYTAEQFSRVEKGTADLVIRVLGAAGSELALSDVMFNVPPEAIIDVMVGGGTYRGPSEFERLVEEITPLLDGVTLATLQEDEQHRDITFLGQETGHDPQRITFLHTAHRLAQQTEVDAAVFYGLLRQGLPARLRRLVFERPERLEQALTASLEQNLIPTVLAAAVTSIVERLQDLAVDVAFEPDPEEASPPIGVLLGTSPQLSPERQRQFVQFVLRHPGEDDFWEQLAHEPGFDPEAVGTIRFTVEAGWLLFRHAPTLALVQELKERRGWTCVEDVAALSREEWRQLIGSLSLADLPRGFESADGFADAIAFRADQHLSTAAVAHYLATDDQVGNGDLRG